MKAGPCLCQHALSFSKKPLSHMSTLIRLQGCVFLQLGPLHKNSRGEMPENKPVLGLYGGCRSVHANRTSRWQQQRETTTVESANVWTSTAPDLLTASYFGFIIFLFGSKCRPCQTKLIRPPWRKPTFFCERCCQAYIWPGSSPEREAAAYCSERVSNRLRVTSLSRFSDER